MLHRSFKPAKCKTSLKLATSRIKLLKNKKGEQVKQLKRELAKLLESGQEQTARIRVEHVVREEKTMAAYDLIEIYCELIVARLPIIESQKNCPIDLKEAISSAIFAAPRCADIPELMDVRKHFTAKYGKEFVSAAVELRPDCGVSRLLVEKLSAKAPDGPAKIKILKAIADEHNVNWDHELLAEKESKPPDDLLNGPSTFENAGRIPMNPPNVQASPSPYDKAPSNVQAPPSPYDKVPSNVQVPYRSNERNDVPETYVARPPPPPPFDYSETASETPSYGPPGSDARPSGSGVQGTEFRDADGSTFSPGRQNWNMEFKDATAAAQAAAESAERASMAARAAAQIASHGNMSRQHSSESRVRDEMHKKDARTTSQNLKDAEFSGRGSMSRQHTTESHKSARDEAPQNYAGATGQRGHRTKDPVNTSRHESYSGMHHEQIRGNKAADLPEQSGSFEASPSSFDGETSVDEFEKTSRRNSSGKFQAEHFGDVNTKSASSENIDYHDEVRIRKQPSNSSSRSRSSSFGNDHDGASSLFARDSHKDLGEEPFVNDIFESNIKETNPYDAFDDSGSDDDKYNVDLDHSREKHESSFGFSPPGQHSSSHLFQNADSWSPRQNVESPRNPQTYTQSHFFTEEESTPMPSESPSRSSVTQDLPVTFDNSDAPSSESEEELEKPKFSREESVDSHEDKKDIFSQKLVEATDDSDEPAEEPGSDSDKELKLGNLIGGLRNKGLKRPPYSRIHQSNASSSREAAPVIEQPPPPVEFPEENRRPSTGASILQDISSEEDSDDELPKPTLRSSTEEKYDQSGSIGRNRKPISTAPLPFFDSDSDEDLPKRTSVNDSQPKTVFSRRTKTSPSSTDKPSSFRTSVFSDPSETGGSPVENKSFSRRSQPPPEVTTKTRHSKREPELQDSYDQFPEASVIHGSASRRSQAPETVSKTRPQKRESSDQLSEQSTTRGSSNTSFSIRSQATEPSRNTRAQMKDSEIQERYDRLRMEQASVTKPVSETRKPSVDDSSRSERKKPSETRKPSVDDSLRSERKKPTNAASEKSPSGSVESGEGSKPSHVHPKLPDFDTLTAHFQSLRQSR